MNMNLQSDQNVFSNKRQKGQTVYKHEIFLNKSFYGISVCEFVIEKYKVLNIFFSFTSLTWWVSCHFFRWQNSDSTGTNEHQNPIKKRQKKEKELYIFVFFIKFFLVHPSHMTYFTFCTDLLWHLYCTLNLVVNKGMRCADVDTLCPASFWLLLCPFCYSSTVNSPPTPNPPAAPAAPPPCGSTVSEGLREQVVIMWTSDIM